MEFESINISSNEELAKHVDNVIDEYDETMLPYERIIENAVEDELMYVVKVKKLDTLKSNLLKKLGFRTIIHFIACAIVYGGINLFRSYPLDSMICIYIGQLIAFYSMDIVKQLEECDYKNRKQIRLEKEESHIRTENARTIYINKQKEALQELYALRDYLAEIRFETNFIESEQEEELEELASTIDRKILSERKRKLEITDTRLLLQH